jgi:hypothetical protein
MLDRCYNPANDAYKNYGGRGIVVCETWRNDFFLFKEWAEETGYNPALTIERRNNHEGYSPSNCTWATYEDQAYNKRNTRFVAAFGETKTTRDWLRDPRCKVSNRRVLLSRIDRQGWSAEAAITTETRRLSSLRLTV